MEEKNQGEGNRTADRRYRRGVRKTVQDTTEEERAEEIGKAKKRPASSEREI